MATPTPTPPPTSTPAEGDGTRPRRPTAAELDAVFGDVLPSQTTDDLDDRPAGGAAERDAADAERLLREVPPHHGS